MFWLLFARYCHNLKTVKVWRWQNFSDHSHDMKKELIIRCNPPKTLMSKKCTQILRIDQPLFEIVVKCSTIILFECSLDAIFKRCHFQGSSFSKCAAKNVLFSCELEAYPQSFSVLNLKTHVYNIRNLLYVQVFVKKSAILHLSRHFEKRKNFKSP